MIGLGYLDLWFLLDIGEDRDREVAPTGKEFQQTNGCVRNETIFIRIRIRCLKTKGTQSLRAFG